jgi:hypothetical protein
VKHVHAWKSEKANGLDRTNKLLHTAIRVCSNDTIRFILYAFGFKKRKIKILRYSKGKIDNIEIRLIC